MNEFECNRESEKKISKRYIQWVALLCENEMKGTFFVLRLFLDTPIVL